VADVAHNRVTVDTVNPVVVHLAGLGHFAGYDPLLSTLAASIAAKSLEVFDFDVDALVAHYHATVKSLEES
jgi:hypothetical protein